MTEETKEVAFNEQRVAVLVKARDAVERELATLNELNRRKAIMEMAELFEISSNLLYIFMECGEEEGEKIMQCRV